MCPSATAADTSEHNNNNSYNHNRDHNHDHNHHHDHAGVVLKGEVTLEAEGSGPAVLTAGEYSGAVKLGEPAKVAA